MATIPEHLAPTNCYVCGRPKHDPTNHYFWSNADAAQEFAKQPQGPAGAEARYVEQHRPY